jgi:DNA helicase II / ATP-dependent DNA helicase PcrA
MVDMSSTSTTEPISPALNPEQREAVEWPGGPMLIFAGAGSGKTRVITHRIVRLMAKGVPAYRIFAVTFTNKAAREMRERVEALVGAKTKDMWIGTFHSLCARMLRIDGKGIGIDPNFVIYDDSDQQSLIRDIFKLKNIDDKSIRPSGVLAEISSAKEKLQSPEQYADRATGFMEKIVSDIYKSYNGLLRKANALDFDDILYYAVRLLEQRIDIREKYQERFQHLLVDEYQDVNYAQYRIVQMLADRHKNVMVVGDDDQSIYAWRGADVSLILRFGSDYPDAKVIKLERNYRSTQNILNAANEVIKRNRSRASKQLWTENPEGALISLTQAGTERDEAMMAAESIMRDVRTGRRKWSDFAVLYRTNAQSRVVEEAFLTMRIPHVLVGGQRFYERKEIKDMMAYLRLAFNPLDDVSVRRVLNVPSRGLGNTSLEKIEKLARERGVPLMEALKDQALQSEMQKKASLGVRAFLGALDEASELSNDGPVTPVLRSLMKSTGYLEMLRLENSQDSIGRLENLQELLNVTVEYDATAEGGPTLAGFLESVALIADVDSIPPEEQSNPVTLMTMHSAKGLEFPIVFILGLEEGVFPHSRSLTSDSEVEEERRLCYVGMTRAKEELHLLHANRRSLYGQPSFNRRSRFLDDVPEHLLTTLAQGGYQPSYGVRGVRQERDGGYSQVPEPPRRVPTDQGPRRSPDWKAPFGVGDRVRHAKFGIGVVVACNPLKADAEVTVAFPGVIGVKKLVQSLAKLEKT